MILVVALLMEEESEHAFPDFGLCENNERVQTQMILNLYCKLNFEEE